MALGPLPRDLPSEKEHDNIRSRRKKSTFVTSFAIFLGVSMVLIGILLTLWGLSWQSNLESTNPLDEDETFGSPLLIPLGILFIGFGAMWIWNGYHGFPRRNDLPPKRCPNCGREIEEDLNFCYYCNTRLEDEVSKPSVETPRRAEKLDRPR
jgi:predicted nucleic acid-binding Zn ribbon protein